MRTSKLAVTVFALGLAAAYGCSSSNDPNPGTGGTTGGSSAGSSGGSAAGGRGGGTAGSSTAGTGGSSTAGTGGSSTAGTGGSSTAGTGGSSTAGTGGSSTAGTGGSAAGGRGGATAGTGGGTAGTGGGSGGRGGATAGTGGGTAGGGGTGGGASACNVTMDDNTSVLTPTVFCQRLIAGCGSITSGSGTIPAAYMTMAMCMTTYDGRTTERQNCQSYHLCWGVEGNTNPAGANAMTHCQHAWAGAVCN
jgi:hypothetical protein